MTRISFANLVMLALVLSCATPRAARAETYNTCTGFITTIPTVISTQGVWCFKQDLATAITSGQAITINTNNVTIDCNDFKLGGLAAGIGTTTYGIFADNRLNATVRHCNIRGFYGGVRFQGITSGGHAVEDNRFDNNTAYAIYVDGDGSVIRRNRLFDTGGSTVAAFGWAFGIYGKSSLDVLDNTISGVTATAGSNGNAYGMYLDENHGGSISGNRIRGLLLDGTGFAYGITNSNDFWVSLRDNDLYGAGTNNLGLTCSGSVSSAQGNVLSHFQTALSTCSNDGGNVIHP